LDYISLPLSPSLSLSLSFLHGNYTYIFPLFIVSIINFQRKIGKFSHLKQQRAPGWMELMLYSNSPSSLFNVFLFVLKFTFDSDAESANENNNLRENCVPARLEAAKTKGQVSEMTDYY
jgi:hypothetical protein